MSEYRVEVLRSFEEWGRMSKRWNGLLINTRSNTVFLTWEWLSSWAEVFWGEGKKLFIFAVYKKEELVGIAPWYIHNPISRKIRLQVIEFLGMPETGADYLDVFAKRGKKGKSPTAFMIS